MTISNNFFRALVVAVLSFQMVSCGTLLYPERRGQKAGHVDVGVVLLDAIGLLFFLVPGVIAFIVDFSSGCIYLPAGSATGPDIKDGYREVKFDRDHYTPQMLEELIRKETGKDFTFADQRLEMVELKDKSEIRTYFARFNTKPDAELTLLNP